MGIFSKGMTERIRRVEWSAASTASRFLIMANIRHTDTPLKVRHFTAFPKGA